MVTRANLTGFLLGAMLSCFCMGFAFLVLHSSTLHRSVTPIRGYLNNMMFNGSVLRSLCKGAPPTVSGVDLYSKVRVLCWVITNPSENYTRAIAIWNTWGKHCNKVLFVTTQPTSLVPAFVVDLPEGREHLTGKTMQAFNHSYHHHLDGFEWFMKADDDTFVIVENLRFFLSKFSPEQPSYYGYHYDVIVKQGYYSGGSGYVLSREALRRMVENGTNLNKCRLDGGAEDAEMGLCLEKAGVATGDSRDYIGRERFHPFPVAMHLEGGYPYWYNNNAYHGAWKGLACCSDLSVSFHYVSPSDMLVMDYLIYHLQVHAIKHPTTVHLNDPPPGRRQMRDTPTWSWYDLLQGMGLR